MRREFIEIIERLSLAIFLVHDASFTDFLPSVLQISSFELFIYSSYGQTLDTTTYIGETLFCISTCIFGLILFSQLIGNMQVLTIFFF